jgi:hypothetical protein
VINRPKTPRAANENALSICPRRVGHWLCRSGSRPQQKDAVDPQAVQQRDLLGVAKALEEFGELSLKVDEAFNKGDAASVAALFTEDGVLLALRRHV